MENRCLLLEVVDRVGLALDVGLGGGQDLGRLLVLALDRVRPGEEERGPEPAARVHGSARQADAELWVSGEIGRGGGVEQGRGGNRFAGLQQPARDAQRVSGLGIATSRDGVGEGEAGLTRGKRRQRSSECLPVERMGERRRRAR